MNSIKSILSKRNLIQYVYTLGVMVSGMFLSDQFGGFDSGLLWVSSFVVALGWVGYYHFVVFPRFERLDGREREMLDDGT